MIDLVQPADLRVDPFPHTTATRVIPEDLCALTLDWMETEAPWKLQIADFYEQWEMHIEAAMLPARLWGLCAPAAVEGLREQMLAPLASRSLRLTEVTAHKLVAGQTIRVHNDYRHGGETHRLVIQLNRSWRDEQGGMLMLFSSPSPDDVRRIIRPMHGAAMAFQITSRSFHAVSTIRSGDRYTLVYSFREMSHWGQ